MIDLCMVNDYIESLFIKISNDAMPLVIGLIYRPSNSNIVQLTDNLNDILGQVSHIPCYIRVTKTLSSDWTFSWSHAFKLFITNMMHVSHLFLHSWLFLSLYIMNHFQLSRQTRSTEITFLGWVQDWKNLLTHWGRDKMAAISQTTLANAFSWVKISEFRYGSS